MNKQDEKKRVTPKLRFPEFQTTLGWEASSVSKTCKSFSGGTPNTANKHFYGGKIPFIRSAEIELEKTELFLTEEGLNNSSAKMVNKGDVLVALYGANSGNVALSKIDGAINQAILCLQHQNNNAFLYHILSYNQEKIVNTYIQGGQGNLSGEIIKSIKLPFPSPKEQQKIADCLSSIDELINFREQKLAALKQHKKGLMQQLFPSHNDLQASKQASKQAIVYPKLRFPQFKDCEGWRVVRISDLLVEKKRPVKLENETEYCLVTVKRRHGGIALREVAKGKEIKVQSQFRVFTDDFLISKRQIVHCACGVLPEELDGSIVSNEYSVLNAKENVNITFFNYFCHQPIVEKSFLDCSSGIVIEKMLFKLDEWMKQEFYFPKNPKEQQAIADCLSSLDKLINEENEQIGRLKDHKKGLMQQLFPKIQ